MPRLNRQQISRAFETAEQEVGQKKPRKMAATGKAEIEKAEPVIDVVDRPVDSDWADMMQFAKMPITIVVNETTDKNAENPVYCSNNGDLAPVEPTPGWLYRGKEYTIERRFVESLARAKVTTYSQREQSDPATGIRHIVNVPHVAPRYQFRVVHDPHPRGADWLRSILLEPA